MSKEVRRGGTTGREEARRREGDEGLETKKKSGGR